MIDTSKLTGFFINGVELTELHIDGVKVWGGAAPSPYTEVPCIAATGKACISMPSITPGDNPTVHIDMEMMPDLTRFYHGFSGSYVGAFVTNHASNYKFMLSVHEWQLGSLANSDARNRQIVTCAIDGTTVTLTSNLVEGSLQKIDAGTPASLGLNLFCADKFTYFGGSYVYSLTVEISGETQVWKTVVRNEDGAVGIYNESIDSFLTNTNTVGSIFVPSDYSDSLIQLSIQPDGTSGQQEQQLLAMGVS